jgi:hypothetical protein
MIVIGVVLSVAALVLLALARRNAGEARRLAATESVTPAELVHRHESAVRDARGAGTFVRAADTSGVVRCAAPLTAPLSATPCVHFRATVTACIEELRAGNDAHGRPGARWERHDTVVSDHEQGTTFEVLDGDAAVAVAPRGAEVDAPLVTVDRFEQDASPGVDGLSIAGLPIGRLSLGSGGRRVLGYRHVEHVVPVGARVHVHGSADDRAGRLTFCASEGRPLVISTRSKEEIVASELRFARWQRIAAAGCAAGVTALAIASLVAA